MMPYVKGTDPIFDEAVERLDKCISLHKIQLIELGCPLPELQYQIDFYVMGAFLNMINSMEIELIKYFKTENFDLLLKK